MSTVLALHQMVQSLSPCINGASIGPGDEVIVPTLTYIASVNA